MVDNNNNQTVGQAGEKLAASYLTSLGYQIIEQNFRTPRGEIDIIAQDGEQIVFVEVKTRNNARFGLPEEAVNQKKLAKIKLAGQYWLNQNQFYQSARIDLIAILNNQITHYPDIR